MTKKLGITNDHAAINLKKAIMNAFPDIEWVDVGASEKVDGVDYPDYAGKLAALIEKGDVDSGVAMCGSGVGISIALNRSKDVRAVLCSEPLTAQLSREHNDANVIVFGERLIGENMAIECVKTFLNTQFDGGRHVKRVEKLGQ